MKSKDQNKLAAGAGKKLKDYPAVPGTPPPEPRKDKEVVCLEKERDRERVYLSVLQRENAEIEKILHELEKELHYVKGNFPQNLDGDGKIHADNEYWFKYETQMEVNRKLERERRQLESEIKQMEDQGMINLDSLTQSELILYVKQLERTKTDLLSDLRAKEWSLDKQAKDYHHLNETKRALEAEIRHYDGERALFQHYKRISCPSASRQPSQKSSARRCRLTRQKDLRKPGDGKSLGSVSQENLSVPSARDVMFRSLDESSLEATKRPSGEPKRVGKDVGDRSKTPERKKTVTSLPELSKRSKTPPGTSKTVRGKSGYGVGDGRARPSTSSSVKIIVTDESEGTLDGTVTPGEYETPVTARSESGIGSPSEEYEDDFEESDPEPAKDAGTVGRKRYGSATWREPAKPTIHFREETFEKRPEVAAAEGVATVVTESVNGSRFTITIRILGRIVSNPSAKCTINSVEATVVPR
ncbi:UNVERIFIED_CONTAM: hypothetical protein PYX00_002099 [Menopon gallinae]|uniref:Uncharacterized protein n=1 Tax=Menopon gallinae TaxID=328185 RepID=A0AAW2IGR1_9NEOP